MNDLLSNLPAYLGGHLLLSLAALACGVIICLPLGILASRRPVLAEITLGVAGVLQTVPSLALLGILVVLLKEIGFRPALVALTLYSLLPILASTITGIRGVDPSLTEAARGLGMSEWQLLRRVELPLAMPVMISGIRTSTVLIVGTATLVTPVGGACLGNYIFQGLETLNTEAVIFGCVVAALLAIALDQLVRLLEVACRRRSRPLLAGAAATLLLIFAAGLWAPASQALTRQPEAVIATGPFTEQHILDEVLAAQLQDAGFRVERHPGTSEGIQLLALFASQVDCIVNYTGNIWTLRMKRTDTVGRLETLDGVRDYLEHDHGVVCLELGFQNNYVVAVSNKRADEMNGSLEGFGAYAAEFRRRHNRRLVLVGDLQFFGRPEWQRFREVYAVSEDDVEKKEMSPTLMYEAMQTGKADAMVAYSTDRRTNAYHLRELRDSGNAFPPYDAVLLLSREAARDPKKKAALEGLAHRIHASTMMQANSRVDEEHRKPREAAAELLRTLRLTPPPTPPQPARP